MPRHRIARDRSAFTLIELLVVIAIIGVLIGLLLPAVQKVRAAAARTQCTNNLKQIGLGMQMYQDSYGTLPTGWLTNAATQPNPGWNWTLLLLPYVEQQNLYTNISPDTTATLKPAGTAAQNAFLQQQVKTFICPSDGSSNPLNPYYSGGIYARSNYVVNREVTGPNSSSLPANMSIQNIQDGSSNTILVGERDTTINVGAVLNVRSNTSSCSFEGRPGPGLNPNPKTLANKAQWTTGDSARLAFSSLHSGGANFVLADGSVHFISTSIDADPNDSWTNYPANFSAYSFQNLIHPNDGMVITYQMQ